MHWYDTTAIFVAIILSLWADRDSGRAVRASIIALVGDNHWVRAFELRQLLGPSVYPHLRRLVNEGWLEQKTDEGNPYLRGGRPDFLYRRKVVS